MTAAQPETTDSGRDRRQFLAGAFVLFLASRGLAAWHLPLVSDVLFYAGYALEAEAADQAGVSLHQFHRDVLAQANERRLAARRPPLPQEIRWIEYPPLAVAFMRLPAWLTFALPSDADTTAQMAVDFYVHDRMQLRPRVSEELDRYVARYLLAYRVLLAGVDLGCLVLLAFLVERLFAGGTILVRFGRLMSYVVGGLFLFPYLYDRLDLVMAALTLAAFAMLISRRHYLWSFGVLVLAIHFKLIPLIFAPLWCFGSLPAAALLNWQTRAGFMRLACLLAARAIILAALAGGLFALLAWTGGPGSWDFLRFHQERGIHLESCYALMDFGLEQIGGETTVYHQYGAFNVRSPRTPALLAAASGAMLLLLVGSCLLMAWRSLQLARSDEGEAEGPRTLAQQHPGEFAALALLVLLWAIVSSKVLSPQYLLLALVFVPLLPGDWPARGRFARWFLLACMLSTVLFPFMYLSLTGKMVEPVSDPPSFEGPNRTGIALLLVRNGILVVLSAALTWEWLRRCRHGERPAGPP